MFLSESAFAFCPSAKSYLLKPATLQVRKRKEVANALFAVLAAENREEARKPQTL